MTVGDITRRDFVGVAGLAALTLLVDPVELFTGQGTDAVASTSQKWTGLHKKLLDEYEAMKAGELDRFDSLPRSKKQITNYNYATCGKGKGIAGTSLARLEFGINGTVSIAKQMQDSYIIITPPGIREYIPTKMVVKEKWTFEYIKKVHNAGGTIQMLGFPEGFHEFHGIKKRNPRTFHPGKTLAESYIEEIIDSQDALAGYEGRPTSKIYKVDPKTAKEGKFIGYLVDVYTPGTRNTPNGPVNFVVKKFIGQSNEIPEYIFVNRTAVYHSDKVIKSYDNVSERLLVVLPHNTLPGKNIPGHVKTYVFNNKGLPDRTGPFNQFDAPLVIAGINRPEVSSGLSPF